MALTPVERTVLDGALRYLLDITGYRRDIIQGSIATSIGNSSLLSVTAVSTVNLASLSGLAQTVNTVPINTDGMRVWLTAQASAVDNGIWIAHSGAWTRSTDLQAGTPAAGTYGFVERGTAANSGWICTNTAGLDIVGTHALTFVQFNGVNGIIAGNGITITGNTLSVFLSLTPGLEFSGSGLQVLVDPNGGIDRVAAGIKAKLNGTTLQSSSSGLSVKGLPSLFEVNGSAVGATVTAPNLNTLTNGSNADALHVHSGSGAKIPFTFSTSSPLVLGAVTAGQLIYWAAIVFTTPFDDPAATVSLGTVGIPGLVLSAAETRPTVAGTYENQELIPIAAPDNLILTIAPGASTQGAGIVFYELRN